MLWPVENGSQKGTSKSPPDATESTPSWAAPFSTSCPKPSPEITTSGAGTITAKSGSPHAPGGSSGQPATPPNPTTSARKTYANSTSWPAFTGLPSTSDQTPNPGTALGTQNSLLSGRRQPPDHRRPGSQPLALPDPLQTRQRRSVQVQLHPDRPLQLHGAARLAGLVSHPHTPGEAAPRHAYAWPERCRRWASLCS